MVSQNVQPLAAACEQAGPAGRVELLEHTGEGGGEGVHWIV